MIDKLDLENGIARTIDDLKSIAERHKDEPTIIFQRIVFADNCINIETVLAIFKIFHFEE